MFWGLVVQPNKKYSKTVSTPFHVSQAVLDTNSISGDPDVQLILKSDKVDYILCILKKSGTVQVPLDLIFSEGDEISFRSVGGTVHLTGYLVDEQDFPNLGEDGESSDADEDIPTLVPLPKQKGQKHQAIAEQDSSSENENSAESQGDDASDDDDELDDDESDDDEVDGSDEEDAEPTPKKSKMLNGVQNGTSKKGENKHKEPKQKKQQEQSQQQATEKTAKVIQGGVRIEDLRVGQGAAAKSGKKVQVYYEGRFKNNNKVFDKTNTGKGFEFVLGRNDVIKGWDVGVQGMKVGGKRRIVCPPNMAYGSKGSPPAIPSNATLVFDVELRGVN